MLLGESTRPRAAATTWRHGGSVALSCRVRLARNLLGEPFPDWADEACRRRLFDRIATAVVETGALEAPRVYRVGELSEVELQLLCERRLASHDLAERGEGAGLVVAADGRISVMINEEDHLRIQVIQPGMDVGQAWEAADALDTRLESRLSYAFSQQLGYLTACPSNLGTGLRASVMVHLLGLRLSDELDAVLRALERLRLAVRGVGGEGSEAAGHMFQISNMGTLGQDDKRVIGELMGHVEAVVRAERQARLRLMRDCPVRLQDCVARALALLQQARVMQTEEAIDYLSALRLGVEMGMLRRLDVAGADALMLAVQPGNLQQRLGEAAEPEQRDPFRADWLRKQLAAVTFKG